jgi:hypothetical protein
LAVRFGDKTGRRITNVVQQLARLYKSNGIGNNCGWAAPKENRDPIPHPDSAPVAPRAPKSIYHRRLFTLPLNVCACLGSTSRLGLPCLSACEPSLHPRPFDSRSITIKESSGPALIHASWNGVCLIVSLVWGELSNGGNPANQHLSHP